MEYPENSFDPIANTAPLPDFLREFPQAREFLPVDEPPLPNAFPQEEFPQAEGSTQPEEFLQPEEFPQEEVFLQQEEPPRPDVFSQPEPPSQPDVFPQLDESPQLDASAFQHPEPVTEPWVPETLSRPIEFSNEQAPKQFGAMVQRRRKPIGVGYVMAGLCIPLFALLFVPLLGGGSEVSDSLLTVAFGSMRALVAEMGSMADVAEAALFWVRCVAVLLFILPPLIALLSIVSRGLARFFLVLLPTLFGGGIFVVLRVFNPSQAFLQGFQFLPAIDLSILIYFLILVFAFVGGIGRKTLIYAKH